jgi:hypothetical protein
LAVLSLACVLRDQGSLLALEAAPPPPKTKAKRALQRMALAETVPCNKIGPSARFCAEANQSIPISNCQAECG